MEKRSLVLVTVDCLRADHVGFQGYSRPVTPFLDALADDSVIFTDAVVSGAPTYFSFPGIMASRHPMKLGREILGIAPDEPVLATAARQAGHKTAAFLAGNPYLNRRFGYQQGFDQFDDGITPGDVPVSKGGESQNTFLSKLNRRMQSLSRHFSVTATVYDDLYFRYCQHLAAKENPSLDQLRRYPAADVIVDRACEWLSNVGTDHFFLWIHLMDPHHPYYPPEEALAHLGFAKLTAARARYVNSFWNRGDLGPGRLRAYRQEIIDLYDAGIYWADKQVERLVAVLKKLHIWDDTVFAVTADHGEEFLEHDVRYHSPMNLPEPLVHVPLLVRAPGLRSRSISQRVFSLIHLAPTLLDGMGAKIPGSFQGRSCWEQIAAGDLPVETAITESMECGNPFHVEERSRPRVMAIRDGRYKLILRFSDRSEDLYDLKNDPEERSPLPQGMLRKERARLLREAQKHLQSSRGSRNFQLALRARLREIKTSEQRAEVSAVALSSHAARG